MKKGRDLNTVYNVACGEQTTLNDLFAVLRENLARFDAKIADVEAIHGPERTGDIPHSLADIQKARVLLGYDPTHTRLFGTFAHLNLTAPSMAIPG